MKFLEGKTAVVTGGNSGIGLAIAQRFVEAGARVAIVGRRAEAVDAAVASLGQVAMGIVSDLADRDSHTVVAHQVRESFGTVDIYVANAGTIRIQSSIEVSVRDFDEQFGVNARAVFFGVQAMLPLLRDDASILPVSSIATSKLLDGHAVYAGTKAAMEAFARSWAIELAPRRIRVNVLSPGPTDTPILGKLGVPEMDRGALEAQLARRIPLGRLGEPVDLAEAALFLASDAGRFITGVNLKVDGGLALT
jgi:NAD(P)-dependent dehydrogenase (short-subunit alcohol dehydrogenase family)